MSAIRASVDLEKASAAVRASLAAIGEDPGRDGLLETPGRVARSYAELLSRYAEDPGAHLERQFEVDHDEMVIVRNIAFSSMCEHHLLPFIGAAHIAYIPGEHGRVCGLSKLARVVDGIRGAFKYRNDSPSRSPTQSCSDSTPPVSWS